MSEILVRLRDVSRTFGSGERAVRALQGVTCDVRRGDRIAVVGRSGSGKSTLLAVMAGIETPDHGSIEWPALGPREALRPSRIAVIFQDARLVPSLDVTENVALPLLLAGRSEPEAIVGAHIALLRLGIADLAHALPDELSGGQAQRVSVARALGGRTELILADEPTGQLDRATGERLIDALLDVVDRAGTALVLATHDDALAARLAKRWSMSDGTLAPA